MPLSRTDYKNAMRSVVLAGRHALELTRDTRWRRSSLEESHALTVLAKVVSVGLDAQDVLDQMEENDG